MHFLPLHRWWWYYFQANDFYILAIRYLSLEKACETVNTWREGLLRAYMQIQREKWKSCNWYWNKDTLVQSLASPYILHFGLFLATLNICPVFQISQVPDLNTHVHDLVLF